MSDDASNVHPIPADWVPNVYVLKKAPGLTFMDMIAAALEEQIAKEIDDEILAEQQKTK